MTTQNPMTSSNSLDPRAAPDAAFIESIRRRFPVEQEIDRIMTRKMELRSGAGYSAIPLEQLADYAKKLITAHIGDDFRLNNPRWLHGGASKLQMAFDLEWRGPNNDAPATTTMVMRMEPPAGIVETSRLREFEILRVMEGVIPVPEAFWVDADGEHLPYPGLIYEFSQGVTKPTQDAKGGVTGIGTSFNPELRAVIAEGFIQKLAAIHNLDQSRLSNLKHFDAAETGSNASIIKQVNGWRRIWEEDRLEELPLVNVIAQWLIDNAPILDHVSVVHGDYRTGNFLFSEEDQKITAILDWELSLLGDRHQDLSWAIGEHFGQMAEDGKTFLACGLITPEEFLHRYEEVSGLSVDPEKLRYFRIFNDFQGVVTMLGSAGRVAVHSKTHQDIVVAWLSMIGHVILGNMRDMLEEVI